MKYINERIVLELGIDWPALLEVIEESTLLIENKDVSQPIKPYLRFNDHANRIIAMPAYVGGRFNSAGIKWIASFPANIKRSIKRAHSVLVLNDTDTGAPTAVFNTTLLSGIRTASVSGFVLKKYFEVNNASHLRCGIVGFGPIGQLHLQMLATCFGNRIDNFYLYDLRGITAEEIEKYNNKKNVSVCASWQEVYDKVDIFVTCTVSAERYVNLPPKKGGIYLNISLRDFHTDFVRQVDLNVVDSWDEVCRENTDIENAHKAFGLSRAAVLEIADLLHKNNLADASGKSFMFNPMGMAVYDIAVAAHFQNVAIRHNNFIELED